MSQYKLTRQGVRDLGNSIKKKIEFPPDCDHTNMIACCYGKAVSGSKKGKLVACGHWVCKNCGLEWDDGAEK